LVEQVARTNNRKTVYAEFYSNSTFLYVYIATAYLYIKECTVTKEFCIYSLPVVSACNLLNQNYILNCKFKIFTMPTQNTSYTKSPKFISSSKFPNTS